jgi:ribosomal-protein-alanine N-acetyltransferase
MALGIAVTVDAMRMADVPGVHEVERLSFATPWPAHAFEQELTGNRLARYVVARAGSGPMERVVGFAGVWLMVDEAHITTFGVHPDWRRQGIGRRLMVRLLELAGDLRARRMTLEVRAGNLAAQELYRGFGFDIAGRRPRYYTDDGEDALVMTTPPIADPGMRDVLRRERERLNREPA